MRKRYYIFIVTHDWDGQLRRIPIPVKWVGLFVVCAAVGALTLFGFATSYGRMVSKVNSFNQMRKQQDTLMKQLVSAQQDANQFKAEVASLGSLASEVSALYNFKHNSSFKDRLRDTSAGLTSDVNVDVDGNAEDGLDQIGGVDVASLYTDTLNNFQVLESSALQGSLPSSSYSMPYGPPSWQPAMWPVRGEITSSFGERLDPFSGEGAFHTGLDIFVPYNTPVHCTADGIVIFAGQMSGYGRVVIVDHGHGLRTLYGHLAGFAVTSGQQLTREEVVGFVGESGRATGPHLHYEVRINQAPVNPYRYLHP